MRIWMLAMVSVLALNLVSCAQKLPRYRTEALVKSSAVRLQWAAQGRDEEFASITDALEAGDRFLERGKLSDAEQYYLLALRKAEFVEQLFVDEQLRLEAQKLKAEEERREVERQRVLEEKNRKLIEERELAAREISRKAAKAAAREKEREVHSLAVSHAVKRGETLPQIAARPDVYGDALLWPLIYRANRDQIRDPKRIWPGQLLKIPRNVGRDDIAEARRYAQERRLP